MPHSRRIRDLTLVELAETVLVIACDSAGGIGPKPLDKLDVSGEMLGCIITSVPLMEVLASGATPVAVVNTLNVEMDPTGAEIVSGVRKAVQEAGLPLSVINGSTEENMPTEQTGLGVTVIGAAGYGDLRLGSSRAGDLVCCVGKPLVGEEYLRSQQDTARISTVRTLLGLPGVHEILPVGSKGILYELSELARLAGLGFDLLDTASSVDLHKPAGPAACLLVSMAEGSRNWFKDIEVPLTFLAKLV